MAAVAVGAVAGLCACGGGGSIGTLSDDSKCKEWNKADSTARQAYAGHVYERVRRGATRLNPTRYVVENGISETCRRSPGARLGSVKGACEKYAMGCKPLRVPSYVAGGLAKSDAETTGNLEVASGAIEACYLTSGAQDYSHCQKISDAKVALGTGPGEVQIAATAKDSYKLVARSPSGVAYRLEKHGGGVGAGTTLRMCSPRSRSMCSGTGMWTGP